ncbi:hypothetical protein OAP83_01735 [Rickettsiales bacterium]|nr:hypothetical protein [Rickettsiales bacterium]
MTKIHQTNIINIIIMMLIMLFTSLKAYACRPNIESINAEIKNQNIQEFISLYEVKVADINEIKFEDDLIMQWINSNSAHECPDQYISTSYLTLTNGSIFKIINHFGINPAINITEIKKYKH